MTDVIDTKAELIKLARVLGEDIEALAFLEPIGWQELREFRHMVADQFFLASESRLKNLAAAAKMVPNAVIIKLAPMYFEPRMAAGVASLVDEEKALKLVPKLPPDLMAATVPYIDPRRVGPLVAKVPVEVARKLAPILLGAKEYVSLGQLIDYVTADQLQGLLPYIDDVSLLKIAEVAENKAQFDVIMPLIDDARIARILQTAKEADLLDIAIELLNEVNLDLRGRLANIAAQQSDSVLDGLVRAVHASSQFDMLLPTTASMTPPNLVRFAQTKAFESADVMNSLVDTAVRMDQWSALLALVPNLTTAGLDVLAQAQALQDRAVVAKVVASDAFASALPLISRVPDAVRDTFAAEIGSLDPARFDSAVRSVLAAGRLPDLLALVPLLPKAQQDRVSAVAADFDPDEMRSALVDASESGVLPEMLGVAAGMPLEARAQTLGIINESADDDDLLGTALEPDEQQNLWNQLLRLTDNVPSPLVQQLSERAAFLPLDNILPSVLRAGELTNEWGTSFAILSGIHDRAEKEGVPVEFTIPARLMQAAAEKASEHQNTDSPLWFAKALLAQYAKDDAAAKAFDDTAIHASAAVKGAAEGVVQISMGVLGDGVQPIKSLTGKSVAEAVSNAAGVAGGLASSLFGRAKAAGKAVSEKAKDPN
ncbi:hypothetical protein [Antrihabitans sp. YC2-6]|uniref:hypothetical protein n=1 Tax=Antrihabitans sp. YC2-6 TaxID=2799498 RepID=UPI0018F2A1BB|nr:hypothetical protein [Antrihabitans sp. YC2-6]MBJ8346136.1 hypothetical protein [Antrihabitans sp. YC2-6]